MFANGAYTRKLLVIPLPVVAARFSGDGGALAGTKEGRGLGPV